MAAIPARQERLLKVMGVTPWRLRKATAADHPAAEPANDVMSDERVACVVVLGAGATERELEVLGRALRAFGPLTARAARLEVGADGLGHVPVAAAYLVFGEAQARALGHQLPAAVLAAAQIVLVDPLPAIVTEAAAKRRLWNGLRALGRAFARS